MKCTLLSVILFSICQIWFKIYALRVTISARRVLLVLFIICISVMLCCTVCGQINDDNDDDDDVRLICVIAVLYLLQDS